MNPSSKLRNNLIRKIQKLSFHKLKELSRQITKGENKASSKAKTLQLAGSWHELGDDFFLELTGNLHKNRSTDRQID